MGKGKFWTALNPCNNAGDIDLFTGLKQPWSKLVIKHLAYQPRSIYATMLREDYRIGYSGIDLHWEAIDEDISVEELLAGQGDQTRRIQAA